MSIPEETAAGPKLIMNCLFLETLGYESALRLSGHHYARLMTSSAAGVVFSVSSPVTPAHWLWRARDPAIARRFEAHARGFRPPVEVHRVRLRHYVPFSWIPVHRRFPFNTDVALNLSCASYRNELLKRLSTLGFSPDLISIQSMMFAPLLKEFPRAKVWYRMEDLLTGFSDMPRSMIAAEAEVMDRADLITLTSPILLSAVPERHRAKTLVLPNGVDADHFIPPQARPDEYASITKPIALYVGALRSWFHWEWLESAMRALPDVQFVLISPDSVRESARAFPNFLHIPGVAYENLSAYVQHATLGIIPFIPSPLIDAVSPIKLLEFFSCGKPVVSTSWQTLRELSAPAHLAADPSEFIEGIRENLTNADEQTRSARLDFALLYSWSGNLQKVMARLT